jgi:cellulose biosynthesis protein BcsQ
VPEQEATGLTDIMLNRINRAGIAPRTPLMDVHDAIQKNNEGFDIIAADSHLPGITAGAFAMLNPEDRPYIMRGITDELKNEYDYVILDAAPATYVKADRLENIERSSDVELER